MSTLAQTPEPPYYVVIFSSLQSSDTEGYAEMAERMVTLAKAQPGYLGFESARNPRNTSTDQPSNAPLGLAVSYWADLESITAWKKNLEHAQAQRQGRQQWYDSYSVRVARVERAYSQH